MESAHNILVIEDSEADFLLIERRLREDGLPAACQRVASLDGLREALDATVWDVVLFDYSLPQMDFMQCLELVTTRLPDAPLILVSGRVGEEKAVELLKLGLWDFVLKDGLVRLAPAIENGLREAHSREARRNADQALRESQAYLSAIVDNLPATVSRWCPDSTLTYANGEYMRVIGRGENVVGRRWLDFVPEEGRGELEAYCQRLAACPRKSSLEHDVIASDGSRRCFAWIDVPVFDNPEPPMEFLSIGIDITERKEAETEREGLEAQLRQSQKMEAVGQLAGGVAHDFNNMLTAILGHAEFVREKIRSDPAILQDIDAIIATGRRTAELVRQLLAFARKQVIVPEVMDLNEVVDGMLKMLRRLIGENIELLWEPGEDLWAIKMDPAQVDQILANLLVNSRDAISGPGKVIIATTNVELDEIYCAAHAEFRPGAYVVLAVSDDGCGMDKETLGRVFEPFFTTKELGKGTGLGLATVYGIVKQNHGFINIYSEPGQGVLVKVYLPRHGGVAEAKKPASGPLEQSTGSETVLIVEDEASLLDLGRCFLERLGYKVLSASMPAEARQLVQTYPGQIHLLITDVVMPETSGPELWKYLSGVRPALKCLFVSGYTANVITGHGFPEEHIHFLQKPFSLQALGAKIREVLGSP